MITKLLAPKTGLTAESVEIVEWHKKEGDRVEKEEDLLTVETEKASIEVEADRSGYLTKILAQAGETVPVSHPICLIGDSPDEKTEKP